MHTIEIPQSNKTIHIPSHWDELSEKQMHKVMDLAYKVISSRLSFVEFRTRLFSMFTNLKLKSSHRYKTVNGLNEPINEMIYNLSDQLCGWPFSVSSSQELELKYTSIKSPFSIIRIEGKYYHSPSELLSSLTFEEFRISLDYLGEYMRLFKDGYKDESSIPLNCFMATLFRPKIGNGERKPVNRAEIEKESAVFEKVPAYIKYSVILWFTYCVDFLQKSDLLIEGVEVNFSVLFPKSTSSEKTNPGLGWAGLLYDLAEAGIFGDIHQSDKQPLFQVLLFLYKKHLDNEKLKRHAKSK